MWVQIQQERKAIEKEIIQIMVETMLPNIVQYLKPLILIFTSN